MSAIFNLIGAFVSIKVAATIAKGIVNPHVLVGGIIGATLVASGSSAATGQSQRPSGYAVTAVCALFCFAAVVDGVYATVHKT